LAEQDVAISHCTAQKILVEFVFHLLKCSQFASPKLILLSYFRVHFCPVVFQLLNFFNVALLDVAMQMA
jgi:hypothetical protein